MDKLSVLEKAARAVGSVVIGYDEDGDFVSVPLEARETIARAVLLAVRAAEIEMTEKIMQNFAHPCWDEDARLGFTAMIDAILEGE